MNAKRLTVTLLFTAILMGFFIWITSALVNDAARKNRIWKEESKKVTEAIEYIQSRHYDIMFYGESLKGPSAFTARHVYDLEDELMDPPSVDESCQGRMLIIADQLGNVPLTQDQWKTVFKLMTEEKYVIVYLGSAQLETIQKTGFFFKTYPTSTRSVILWNGGADCEFGFADNEKMVPEVVLANLSEEQKPIYTMIMKIASEKYF